MCNLLCGVHAVQFKLYAISIEMYERYYREFCNEVHRIFSCYLFWRIINNRAAEDKRLLSALNKTPLSWIVIRHSLNVTLFITLGRVFDVDSDAFSVDTSVEVLR